MMKCCAEGVIEGSLQTIRGEARWAVILNCFGCWELSFFDPVYKLPRTSALVRDFFDFAIEEWPFGFSGGWLESLPGFLTPKRPIVVQSTATWVSLPLFWMFRHFWFFSMFCPCLIDNWSQLVNYGVEPFNIIDIWGVEKGEICKDIFEELLFLVTSRSNNKFSRLSDFFTNRDVDRQGCIIRG